MGGRLTEQAAWREALFGVRCDWEGYLRAGLTILFSNTLLLIDIGSEGG